jgi:RNA polymerase sigma-70 factor (ECF subfamily)
VFVKLAVADKHFKDDEHERAWLIRVMINRCHDLQRRRNIRAYTPLDEVTDLPDPRDNERPAVLQAVDTLPEKLKSVVVLHYLEGYSVEKTASILGLSLSATKMRLSRGREMLKIAMEDQEKI